MKKIHLPAICLVLCTLLSSCGLMESAFKAGFLIALILACLVGLLIWIFHFSYVRLARRFPGLKIYLDDLLHG